MRRLLRDLLHATLSEGVPYRRQPLSLLLLDK